VALNCGVKTVTAAAIHHQWINNSKEQWEVIGTHMRVRANVTEDEANKIVAFLQGSGQ